MPKYKIKDPELIREFKERAYMCERVLSGTTELPVDVVVNFDMAHVKTKRGSVLIVEKRQYRDLVSLVTGFYNRIYREPPELGGTYPL